MELKYVPPRPVELDEDFIEYMHTMAKVVCEQLQATRDKQKASYYRGVLYGIKSISQVYEDIVRGEFL